MGVVSLSDFDLFMGGCFARGYRTRRMVVRKRGRNYFLIILAFTHNVDYTAQRTVCFLTAYNPDIMLLARLLVKP